MSISVQTPKYFDENGNELEAVNKTYGTSNFISIPSNVKTIYFKLAQASSYIMSSVVFYDKDKNIIKTLVNDVLANETFEQTVDVPINAKYLRYSNYNGENKNVYNIIRYALDEFKNGCNWR